MKALILNSGMGSRMGVLTSEHPKCMTEISPLETILSRQLRQIEEFSRLEEKKLPADIDYASIVGLRLEAREKLEKIRPENFGQASRISGVSPADVSVLLVYLEHTILEHAYI